MGIFSLVVLGKVRIKHSREEAMKEKSVKFKFT